MVKAVLREGESQHQLMKRFKKAVARSKVMSEVRKKRWFVSDSEERRIAKKKAIRRQNRRTRKRKARNRRRRY